MRHTYNADQVNNEYQQFPEILDGAEGDAQRQVTEVTGNSCGSNCSNFCAV